MKHSKLFAIILAAATLNAFAGEKVVVDGSTTVGPIAKAFAEYCKTHKPGLEISVSESGSGNGAKALINGTCQVATMSRPMKDNELAAADKNGVAPVQHTVAMDGLAVIVNPGNPVKNLTKEQLRAIYTGKVSNWKDVGGPSLKIIVVGRDTNSGTYETFETKVLNKMEVTARAEIVGANGGVIQRVSTTRGAIGYVGLGFTTSTVKIVPVDGIAPSKETVLANTYPIARPLFFYTNGMPAAETGVAEFLGLKDTAAGRDLVEAAGFIAIPEKK